MKRLLSLLLIVLMALTLCACSGKDNRNTGPEPLPDEPEPVADDGGDDIDVKVYTEDDFNLSFDDFDGRDLIFGDVSGQPLKAAYGLWEGIITKEDTGEFADRELCLFNIYEDGSRILMSIDSRLRDEDGKIFDSNHTYDLFELTENGEHPVFKLYGMVITIESVFEQEGVQYLLARMDNDINESFRITMMR